MIISISGKIGSGKDTIGNIIQYLTESSNNITDEEWLVNKKFSRFNPNNWKIKKFADNLNDITCMMIGCTREQLEDQEFKKTVLGPEWDNMTVREFLQKLGTEAMRNGLHENVWVNSLMSDYKLNSYTRLNVTYIASKLPNWIITDTRFPNELEAVKSKEGITIRVVRNQLKLGVMFMYEDGSKETIAVKEHPSETALDDAKFDYEIVNDSTMGNLIQKVRQILIKESII